VTVIRDGYDEHRMKAKYEAHVEEARRDLVWGRMDGTGLPGLDRRGKSSGAEPAPSLEQQLFRRVEARRASLGSKAA
jgi:hypothetical protein